jgi:hypothetical protein
MELREFGKTADIHNTADYVIMINVLHEIPLLQLGNVLGEGISLLKKPGLLIIHDIEHLVHGERSFVPWSGEEVRTLVAQGGADVKLRKHRTKSGIPIFTLVVYSDVRNLA